MIKELTYMTGPSAVKLLAKDGTLVKALKLFEDGDLNKVHHMVTDAIIRYANGGVMDPVFNTATGNNVNCLV